MCKKQDIIAWIIFFISTHVECLNDSNLHNEFEFKPVMNCYNHRKIDIWQGSDQG